MTKLWPIQMSPLKEALVQRAMSPSRDRPRRGSGLLTMPISVIPPVRSARRNLNQPGQRMYRIGSGRMLSRLAVVCITPVVMPKSPKMVLPRGAPRLKRGLAPLTLCWANARQKGLILLVASHASRQKPEMYIRENKT